jgi:uncharacterized damage-inducible protein DinB
MNASNAARLHRVETQLRDFLEAALHGVSEEIILEPPVPGKWSALENLAHLGRYHEIFIERIGRILSEQTPAFSRYRAEEDPQWESWRALAYKETAGRLAALREQLVSRLKSLSDGDYERIGVHSKFGEMSLALWLEFFLVHEAHHLYVVLQLVRRGRSK